jgi:hypothetical protein
LTSQFSRSTTPARLPLDPLDPDVVDHRDRFRAGLMAGDGISTRASCVVKKLTSPERTPGDADVSVEKQALKPRGVLDVDPRIAKC